MPHRLKPLLTALLTALLGSAHAAEPVLDPARIDALFAEFGAQSPGCALGVYRAGEILYAKGYGLADLNPGVPIRPDTVFDIGSSSKQFTAVAVLLLVQDGKLGLDDAVQHHLPCSSGPAAGTATATAATSWPRSWSSASAAKSSTPCCRRACSSPWA